MLLSSINIIISKSKNPIIKVDVCQINAFQLFLPSFVDLFLSVSKDSIMFDSLFLAIFAVNLKSSSLLKTTNIPSAIETKLKPPPNKIKRFQGTFFAVSQSINFSFFIPFGIKNNETDAITAMFMVILKGKKFVYNIGNDKPEIDMSSLHKSIEKSINKLIKHINVNYPKNYPQVEPQRRCPDLSKIKAELKFKNKVSLNNSIKRFYYWSQIYY